MRVLLVAINAKYIHSSLAIRYLKSFCSNTENILIKEYTINDNIGKITADIYKTNADVIAFSCYIWNIKMVLSIADALKKANPSVQIVLGGPEVSYDAENLLGKYHYIDYVIVGEGEYTFKELINCLSNKKSDITAVHGLFYRDKDKNIVFGGQRALLKNLDDIPFPYDEKAIKELAGKIIYYEASRGCPFNCSYCLSSTICGVRYFSLPRVKKDLLFFIKSKVHQVKFVDRTFNSNKKRAEELFAFLLENYKEGINFHFEIAGDLLDDEMIELLQKAPQGYFQFEIGVQSTNIDTVRLIERKTDFEKIAKNVRLLREKNNIHIHLDLISGLPGEDYRTFQKSFDDVFDLRPHMLQLGFLKMLKGSLIRKQVIEFDYEFTTLPPYEVIKNKWMTYGDILKLKGIEYVLEKYYNSGVFEKSLEYLLSHNYTSPFKLFEDLSIYYEKKGFYFVSHSRKALYDILFEFYKEMVGGTDLNIFTQYLKYDLMFNNPDAKPPQWAQGQVIHDFKEKCFDFLKNEENIEKFLPQFKGLPSKKIYRRVKFEIFDANVLDNNQDNDEIKTRVILFDYTMRKAWDVTQDILAIL